MKESTLVASLAELDTLIAYPPVPDVDLAVLRLGVAPSRSRTFALRWAVAAVAVVMVATGLAVAPVREAVAGWLGIDAVRIVGVDEIVTGLDETVRGLGEEVSVARAVELGGGVELWPEQLGLPDRLFVKTDGDTLIESSVVWLPGAGLPRVGSSGVGALLTRFDGALDGPVVEKTAGADTAVVPVTVGIFPGFWLEGGAHTFGYIGPDGGVVLETLRLAGNTLLWESPVASFRFESGLEMEAAIEAVQELGG